MDNLEKTIRKALKYYLIKEKMKEHEGRWSWLDGEWDYHHEELKRLKRRLPDISDILEEEE